MFNAGKLHEIILLDGNVEASLKKFPNAQINRYLWRFQIHIKSPVVVILFVCCV